MLGRAGRQVDKAQGACVAPAACSLAVGRSWRKAGGNAEPLPNARRSRDAPSFAPGLPGVFAWLACKELRPGFNPPPATSTRPSIESSIERHREAVELIPRAQPKWRPCNLPCGRRDRPSTPSDDNPCRTSPSPALASPFCGPREDGKRTRSRSTQARI